MFSLIPLIQHNPQEQTAKDRYQNKHCNHPRRVNLAAHEWYGISDRLVETFPSVQLHAGREWRVLFQMTLAREFFRVVVAFKDHRGTVPTVVLDHAPKMYVSRRIERDRGADVIKSRILASIIDRFFHCIGGVVVGYEVERGGNCEGNDGLNQSTTSLVDWGYLHLNQLASGSGGVLRNAVVVL